MISRNDGKAKLGDFSVSCELESPDERSMNSEGTAAFTAPETQSGEDDGFLILPTDIWSMGITLYAYVTETLPFIAENEYQMQMKAEMDPTPKIDSASDELNDLIDKMLCKEPEDRPTVKEVLEHEWFNSS